MGLVLLIVVVALLVSLLINSGILLLAVKLTKNDATFGQCMGIILLSSLCVIIPGIGLIVAVVVYLALLCKWLEISLFPDALLIAAVYLGVSWLLQLGATSLLATINAA